MTPGAAGSPFMPYRASAVIPLLLSIAAGAAGPLLPQEAREMGTVQLRDRLRRQEKMILVDTRSEEEFRDLHMRGAVNVTPEALEQSDEWIGNLTSPDGRPVVLYGLDSPDSSLWEMARRASRHLTNRDVYVYREGFKQWRWRGYFLAGETLHRYLKRWKETGRDKTDRPEDVMNALAVETGSRVADIGAGYGYFTLHMARRVGDDGIVYSVEILDDLVDQLKERFRQAGLHNVTVVRGAVNDPRLPAGALDGVLVFDTYHEMTHFEAMLAAVKASLRPRGRLAIVDYEPETRGEARQSSVRHHTIPADTVVREVTAAGFELVERQDAFITGKSRGTMYLLVFRNGATPSGPPPP